MIRTPVKRKYGGKSLQGEEAGFTLIEMIIVMVLMSILGTFTFQITTNSLQAMRDMRNRKEMSDDAVMALAKISREVREATAITITTNKLVVEKNVSSGLDTNLFVKYVLDTTTKDLMRQSETTGPNLAALPDDSTSGNVLAKNVTVFNLTDTTNRVDITLQFDSDDTAGSEWKTYIYPRNLGL